MTYPFDDAVAHSPAVAGKTMAGKAARPDGAAPSPASTPSPASVSSPASAPVR